MQHLQLVNLLGLALKSDEIIEVLEYFDLQVVYEFDRLNEGTEDNYWVSARQEGFELGFDADQALSTVFMHAVSHDGFEAIDPSLAGVPFHGSFEKAQAAFASAKIPVETGKAANRWIKGHLGAYSVHYEFNARGELVLVTAMVSTDSGHA